MNYSKPEKIELSNSQSFPNIASKNDCGVIWHYHINKCAGGTIKKLFEEFADAYNHIFMHFWPSGTTRVKNKNETLSNWIPRLMNIENEIERLENNKWIVIKHHHGAPGMYYILSNLTRLKTTVEKQGCTFLLTTVLRDPVTRLLSNLAFNSIDQNMADEFITSRSNWLSRYLLYNLCDYTDEYKTEIRCGYLNKGTFTNT
eukprot:UN31926